ncbi:MAG: histone deacetylase [Actinobacteria bacterium]|nr:histone deacetylase [Actinomycetota bacterium]
MNQRLVVVEHESAKHHDAGPVHPECPERMDVIGAVWDTEEIVPFVSRLNATAVTTADLLRVHRPEQIKTIQALSSSGGGYIDGDTHVSSSSWDAAIYGAGSGLTAVSAIDRGDADVGFVGVRPPGHHATGHESMGFCLLNNIAVTAAALADDGHRVAIIDWDVHHGNGTQDIFWDDPRVLFVSLHQRGIYPGTGHHFERGGPQSAVGTLNVPLPAGATGDAFTAAFSGLVRRAIERFDPEWILVSAGYDGHRQDPLASLALTAGDYADLTDYVVEFASRTKLIMFLEGGYNLRALHESVSATARRLIGLPYRGESPSSGGPGRSDVVKIAAEWERAIG